MPVSLSIEDLWGLEHQLRIPMSFDDYLQIAEGIHAEWVDGVTIVTPPHSVPHGRAMAKAVQAIASALPSLDIVIEPGLHTSETRYREPDVVVFEVAEQGHIVFSEQTPVIVVEVLSPSTRREDMVRKSGEYLVAGVGQYWLVDPDHRTVVVLRNAGAGWATLAELDDAHPAAEFAVGDYGTIALDLHQLLGHA